MNYNITPSQKIDIRFDSPDLDTPWQHTPLYLSPTQILTAEKLLSLINDSDNFKPSLVAGLTSEQADKSHAITLIDGLFKLAVDNYLTDLLKATKSDSQLSTSDRNTSNDLNTALFKGAMRVAYYTPDNRFIGPLIGVPLLFCGGIYGWFKKDEITEETKREECSAHRILWLNKVLVQEEHRKENCIKIISNRVKILKRDIDESHTELLKIDCFEELELLNILMHSISPETALKLDDLTINEYVNLKRLG